MYYFNTFTSKIIKKGIKNFMMIIQKNQIIEKLYKEK